MRMPIVPKRLLLNLALVPASLLLLLVASELFFRFVLPAPDMPEPSFSDAVLRHRPGQRGVFWLRDEFRCRFAINAQGFNSARPDYPQERTGLPRLCLVGDSYVEALQTDPGQSLAEDLEREFGGRLEVFRFGVSGAPLSQYLHMARRAALPCRPDILAVLLVHNDFHESYEDTPGLYTRSFLKLRLGPGTVQEIPPEPYRRGVLHVLRSASATWRYLALGLRVDFNWLRALLAPHKPQAKEAPAAPVHQANIDVSRIPAREARDRQATAYLFDRLRSEAAAAGARPLLVMDGVRLPIERRSPDAMDANSGALRLNRMAAEEAGRLGIPFLDLHPVFAEDFARHGKPFAFPHDGHWNAYAHGVAARAVAARLRDLGWLPAPAPDPGPHGPALRGGDS